MKKLLISILAAISLAGCAAAPTNEEAAAADYGSYPDDYQQIVKSHMEGILKDPDSAKYQFLDTPQKAWNSIGGLKFGYAVCARINAKNSYGAYIGYKTSYFLIRNNTVIHTLHPEGIIFNEPTINSICQKVS